MSEKYHCLCAEKRKVIYNMNKADFSQAEIGRAIGCSQSTVSKELSRTFSRTLGRIYTASKEKALNSPTRVTQTAGPCYMPPLVRILYYPSRY